MTTFWLAQLHLCNQEIGLDVAQRFDKFWTLGLLSRHLSKASYVEALSSYAVNDPFSLFAFLFFCEAGSLYLLPIFYCSFVMTACTTFYIAAPRPTRHTRRTD